MPLRKEEAITIRPVRGQGINPQLVEVQRGYDLAAEKLAPK